MIEQYRRIKKRYPDVLLFFRLGDFYELFQDDAYIASRELQITLTSKEVSRNNRIPMAGIPYHAAENYIPKLLEKGYKVAICEQLEDPRLAKGLVKRDVVKIITPGTSFISLDAESNNYIASVVKDEKTGFGLSFIDLSTGEFYTNQFLYKDWEIFLEGLLKLPISEIVIKRGEDPFDFLKDISFKKWIISEFDSEFFDYNLSYNRLLELYNVQNLSPFGIEGLTLAIIASGVLLAYLEYTQKAIPAHIMPVRVYNPERYMLIDHRAGESLELLKNTIDRTGKFTLYSTLNYTVTPMGARLLKNWISYPLIDTGPINDRLDGVEELLNSYVETEKIRGTLKNIGDFERITGRLSCGVGNARDLLALKDSLKSAMSIKSVFEPESKILRDVWGNIKDFSPLTDLLERAIVDDPPVTITDGGIIKDGFDPEIDQLRDILHNSNKWLSQFEAREKERTGIKSLKVSFNRVFGYYIEVTKSNLHLVPQDYIRKQTLVNAERFITEELKNFEEKVLGADEKLKSLEYELFVKLRDTAGEWIKDIQKTAGGIAILDVLQSFAYASRINNYTRPVLSEDSKIEIKNGRHPVLEKSLEHTFVPNDTYLDRESHQIMLITGPNMAGKSTYMRQVGLIVIMAQMGCFVPADRANIGIVDKIFTRIGAQDYLSLHQSTFMVEMEETARILNNLTPRSLIIFDEVGRGTSTYDGMSLAWALVEYLANHKDKPRTLFATHYHELTALEDQLDSVKNYTVAVEEKEEYVTFLYKVKRGSADRSYGIYVARLAGITMPVIKRAEEILRMLENSEERKSPPRKKVIQPPLFAIAEHPIIEELKNLDVDLLSPLDALLKISEWVKIVKEESGGKGKKTSPKRRSAYSSRGSS
ncbi:TPA: DNA mismatch repair protein MutS [bacterium]|nr:DNA mismatch repair protein MutS [bacterium]